MRFVTEQGETLATMALNAQSGSGTCVPTTTVGPYRIDGPTMEAQIKKEEESGGLLISLTMPDLMTVGIVIEKDDVKQLKGLMNKDAISFMIKAFMK